MTTPRHAPEFHLHSTQGPRRASVAVYGPLDMYTAPDLQRAIDRVIDAGALRVTLDLTACTAFDSRALAVLMRTLNRLRLTGGRLRIANPGPPVRNMLGITAIDQLLDVIDQPVRTQLHARRWRSETFRTVN